MTDLGPSRKDLRRKRTNYCRKPAWDKTPLEWAEYYLNEKKDADSQKRYGEIADYLRAHRPQPPAPVSGDG